jgi:hypothetical protein
MPDPDKRKLREVKRNLAENPEGAAEASEDLGKHRSDTLNRLDNDSTRRKPEDEEEKG